MRDKIKRKKNRREDREIKIENRNREAKKRVTEGGVENLSKDFEMLKMFLFFFLVNDVSEGDRWRE